MSAQGVKFPNPPNVEVYLACIGDRAIFEISYLLRQRGISTEMGSDNRSLKSQMKSADKLGARYTIMVGDDEIDKGVVILRDMISGDQETISRKMIVSIMEDRLKQGS